MFQLSAHDVIVSQKISNGDFVRTFFNVNVWAKMLGMAAMPFHQIKEIKGESGKGNKGKNLKGGSTYINTI